MSLDLCRQFKYDLSSNELAAIQERVETNSIDASLENYSGEQICADVTVLEMKVRGLQGPEAERLQMKIRALRQKARERFKAAVVFAVVYGARITCGRGSDRQ